ncbi:MAG: hypothetical protein J6V72_19760 [Kiritimatiellae bacterium]|nr:hypothetical protein [Kiritimatiellia bacterium]
MVTETTENGKAPFNGTAVTGAALGGAALLVQLLSGAFGNILGGGRPPAGDPPWARDMNYERQLTQADAKIGKLESQLYTDQQVNAVRQEIQGAAAAQAVFNATMNGTVAAINAQTKQLMGMTGLIINGPAMAASEAAASVFTAKATTADAG